MQKLIKYYYSKLNSKDFFINDDEEIIGRAKDVIKTLRQELKFAQNLRNGLDEEEIEFLQNETEKLIKEINNNYYKKDIIRIYISHMAGFYVLQNEQDLYEDLKEYIEEECENGNKYN